MKTFRQGYESSPIKWIVEEREDAEKIIRIELLVVVSHLQLVLSHPTLPRFEILTSHHVEDGKDYVESVKAVESNLKMYF